MAAESKFYLFIQNVISMQGDYSRLETKDIANALNLEAPSDGVEDCLLAIVKRGSQIIADPDTRHVFRKLYTELSQRVAAEDFNGLGNNHQHLAAWLLFENEENIPSVALRYEFEKLHHVQLAFELSDAICNFSKDPKQNNLIRLTRLFQQYTKGQCEPSDIALLGYMLDVFHDNLLDHQRLQIIISALEHVSILENSPQAHLQEMKVFITKVLEWKKPQHSVAPLVGVIVAAEDAESDQYFYEQSPNLTGIAKKKPFTQSYKHFDSSLKRSKQLHRLADGIVAAVAKELKPQEFDRANEQGIITDARTAYLAYAEKVYTAANQGIISARNIKDLAREFKSITQTALYDRQNEFQALSKAKRMINAFVNAIKRIFTSKKFMGAYRAEAYSTQTGKLGRKIAKTVVKDMEEPAQDGPRR